jgi:hypothetical protein
MLTDPKKLSPFLQELTESGTLTFNTPPEDKQQHGIEVAVALSWPPPRWMYEAAERCPYDARVSWNTRGVVNGNSEPVTLVINGGLECSVRYYDATVKDIREIVEYRLIDNWRVESLVG